ncbi:EGF-like domain-containing protein 2 isoform X2 [Babylonia areolata]|uniref:EGF-like domain-containing protein 2 isoform X2 n=1 Tax=Babylonia areolata TaxID=304850 RepID=UPI003FD5BC93
MELRQTLCLVLPFLAVVVQAQVGPTPYTYDCRRSQAGCKNEGTCDTADGKCLCPVGFQEDDCRQITSDVTTCSDDACQNNANCTRDGKCVCNSNTYGPTCANARVAVWCSQTEMFVNIYPHGDSDFSGIIFLSTRSPGQNGRSLQRCHFKNVSSVDVSAHAYVTDANGSPPQLSGFFKVLPFSQSAGDTSGDFCVAAETHDREHRTDHVQRVVVEYNGEIISSLDQVFLFNCSVSKTANLTTLSSASAMSVTILDDDYQVVNVTEKLDPVTFVIQDANTKRRVTNNVNLGDPLDLVFTLRISRSDLDGNDTSSEVVAGFKVTSCTASNSLSASIHFLVDDCPGQGSELLYRGHVTQKDDAQGKTTVIPLNAFRFVGEQDVVSFTCTIHLCSLGQLKANPDACKKRACPGDNSQVDEDSNGNSTDTGTGTDPDNGADSGNTTSAPAGNVTSAPAGETVTGNSTDTATGNGTDSSAEPSTSVRRKREAANEREQEREVTQSISVTSGLENPRKDETFQTETKDLGCEQSQMVLLIIVFAVVVASLLIVIIVLVICMLRKRMKVVEAPDMTSTGTGSQGHYSLPRVSFAGSVDTAM